MSSTRGPGGGFSLARSPERITLHDVVSLFDGGQIAKPGRLGIHPCGDDTILDVHAKWQTAMTAVHDFLTQTTIEDMARMRTPRSRETDSLRRTDP